MEYRVYDDETIEDLQLNGYRLIQKKTGFRYGMDSVLLADFANIHPNDNVVDFGTGTGILLLLLMGRGKGRLFTGIEIQNEYCEIARRNMALNSVNDKVSIICGDAGKAYEYIRPGTIDSIVCNPPYGIQGAALTSPDPAKAAARNLNKDNLQCFFSAAYRILRGKGHINIVYPAPQMLEIMNLMSECHMEPKRFRLIYPFADKAANLVLIEAVKDAKPKLHPMPPLIVFDANKALTNELKSIYHIKEETLVCN